MTPLFCLDLDGQELATVLLPGQIGALAAGDGLVWAAGFRRSRQASVVSIIGPDGTVAGEIGFGSLDLSPWAPPEPPPAPRPPMAEWARSVRDVVEASLTGPVQAYGRFGERWETPAVSEEFRLERVDLHGSGDEYRIDVLFRWAGQDELFGISQSLVDDEDEHVEAPDAYISIQVEEHLLATGYGLENAIREPSGGVTWLRWS